MSTVAQPWIMSPVVFYIAEEVRRQGHNIRTQDGIERVAWMMDAWCAALEWSKKGAPDLDHAEALGKLIERRRNRRGFRKLGVRVGDRECPSPHEVVPRLTRLFEHVTDMVAMEFYREFELIHPFIDGNGRTGKVLLNWLGGTLFNPIFPPSNFWGEEIQNP